MGVPPKSSILIGFSIIFTIHFGGPPLFLETPIEFPCIFQIYPPARIPVTTPRMTVFKFRFGNPKKGNHHLLLESLGWKVDPVWTHSERPHTHVDPYRKALCRCTWCIVESQVSEQKSWNEVSKRSEILSILDMQSENFKQTGCLGHRD